MTLIARSCVFLLELSSCLHLPSVLDRRAASVAVRLVGLYQKKLSSKTGRTCMFRVSCSHATMEFLAEFGWNDGIVRARDRVRSCGGTYMFSTDVFGRRMLIAAGGQAFRDDELSSSLTCRSEMIVTHQRK